MKFVMRLINIYCLILVIVSCATPAVHFKQEAKRLGFIQTIVQGTDFKHVVYTNNAQSKGDVLHVYLDGDGTPWVNNRWVSEDPTPKNPMLLRLMSLDPAPTAYLGRPCYHGFSDTVPCEPSLWTDKRYSTIVVKTMAVALEQILKLVRTKTVVLIGYSGGGTLAMLLAPQIQNLGGIVTIAGNLDIETWSSLHSYAPLLGSMNPAQQHPLDPKLFQLHLAGGKDQNVPVNLIQPTVFLQYSAELIVIPEFDHICCWEKIWPSVLKTIQLYTNNPESFVNKKTLRSDYSPY